MELALSWAAVSAGAVALYWLKLHYGRKDRSESLDDQAEALQADLQSVYEELSDKVEQIHERLDFAERLLATPRTPADEPATEATPPELTPV
jgi:hypothetical protein